MQVFKLCSFHCFIDHNLFELLYLFNFLIKLRALFGVHSHFAFWAVDVIEDDSGSVVAFFDEVLDAVKMVHVTAAENDTRVLADSCAIADIAVVIYIMFRFLVIGHFFNAFRFEAGHAKSFTFGSVADMSTCKKLVTRLLHIFETGIFPADSFKGREHAWRRLLELLAAESTPFELVLLTCLSLVVRFSLTLYTEVLTTCITPDPVLSHMKCRLLLNRLALFIFLFHIYITLHHLHDISTRALYKVRRNLEHVRYLRLFNLGQFVFCEVLVELIVLDLLVACWAFGGIVSLAVFDDVFFEAVYVASVPALRTLNHSSIIALLIHTSDLLVTKLAVPLFSILPHLVQNGLGPISFAMVHTSKCVIYVDFLLFFFFLKHLVLLFGLLITLKCIWLIKVIEEVYAIVLHHTTVFESTSSDHNLKYLTHSLLFLLSCVISNLVFYRL